MKRISTVVLALVVLVGGVSAVAVAKGPGKAKQAKVQQRGLLPAAAAYLGMTPVALRAELRAGTSLSAVATAKGKSVDGLKAALVAAIKTKVDAAVAAGRLDAAHAQRLLAGASAHVERLVNRTRR